MNKHFSAAAIAIVAGFVSVFSVSVASAYESYSNVRDVHIERQCYRYDNFCGTKSVNMTKRAYSNKKKTRTRSKHAPAAVTHRAYGAKPFIDRHCTRYGHFC